MKTDDVYKTNRFPKNRKTYLQVQECKAMPWQIFIESRSVCDYRLECNNSNS